MLRAVAFLAFTLAPLLALAHGGHPAPAGDAHANLAVEARGAIAANVAAPSRCPGGGHEDCCCHDGWCTTTPATLAVTDARWRELVLVPAPFIVARGDVALLPPAALLRFSTRGPPLLA